MFPGEHTTLLFSDLDGCLLNKEDYDYRPAIPTLRRLRELRIPVILASSKTAAEMTRIAAELDLEKAPLICENGGVILWQDSERRRQTTGVSRDTIRGQLMILKSEFRFRSFADLGLSGVVEATSLPVEKAELALDRHSTEPLLWDDQPDRLPEFRARLEVNGLSVTQGGRFYHVAGTATKGQAMRIVAEALAHPDTPCRTIAIGDSPIDQSMLDIADFAICVPAPDGTFYVNASPACERKAMEPGSSGWAQAVGSVLDEISLAS